VLALDTGAEQGKVVVEQLGKEFMRPDDEVVVLVSGATLAAVKDKGSLGLELPPPEQHQVKGHDRPVEVYRLV
jgi:hypothetical protein